jgi:hypothetical protein
MSTNPQGPILLKKRGLYHENVGDKYHAHDGVANNLSLGDDESNDNVEFSKEDLYHLTHKRGNYWQANALWEGENEKIKR